MSKPRVHLPPCRAASVRAQQLYGVTGERLREERLRLRWPLRQLAQRSSQPMESKKHAVSNACRASISDCNKAGGWLMKVAQSVGDRGIVGDALSEAEVRSIFANG